MKPCDLSSARARRLVYAALLHRGGASCLLCGKALDFDADRLSNAAPTIEHKIAASAGGGDHLENLALAHRRCNEKRGVSPLMEFISRHRKGPLPNPVVRGGGR